MTLLGALMVGGMVRNSGAVFLAALWGFWAFVLQGVSYSQPDAANWAIALWLLCGCALSSLLIDWFMPAQRLLGAVLFVVSASPFLVAMVWYLWPR